VADEVAREGLAGQLASVQGETAQFMVFATYWSFAGQLQAGQSVRLVRTGAGHRPQGESVAAIVVSQQNRGVYGSGVNDVVLKLRDAADAARLEPWIADELVRLIPAAAE
jgi:hypothetical protein